MAEQENLTVSNGRGGDDKGPGGRDRYLGELHEDVREIRKDVGTLTKDVSGLMGEWKNFRWVIVVIFGLGVLRYCAPDVFRQESTPSAVVGIETQALP